MSEPNPATRCRPISEAELAAYEADGAAVLRGVLDARWIARMQDAIDRVLERPGPLSMEYTPEHRPGRFYVDLFVWRSQPAFRAFMEDSPMPELAARIMRSPSVRLFYDQLFVKEASTQEATPWHQDLAYWPLRGSQIVSIWIPFDAVTHETGAVVYVKGSHRWGKLFRPVGFRPGTQFDRMYREVALEELPDIGARARAGEDQLLQWDVRPGDVIVHHPLIIHGAGGNHLRAARRRALALRYVGPDARYDARPGTFLQSPILRGGLPPIALADGDPIAGELFPRVWPRPGAGAGA